MAHIGEINSLDYDERSADDELEETRQTDPLERGLHEFAGHPESGKWGVGADAADDDIIEDSGRDDDEPDEADLDGEDLRAY